MKRQKKKKSQVKEQNETPGKELIKNEDKQFIRYMVQNTGYKDTL